MPGQTGQGFRGWAWPSARRSPRARYPGILQSAWSGRVSGARFRPMAQGDPARSMSSSGCADNWTGKLPKTALRLWPGCCAAYRQNAETVDLSGYCADSGLSVLHQPAVSAYLPLYPHMFALRLRGDRQTRRARGRLDEHQTDFSLQPMEPGRSRPRSINIAINKGRATWISNAYYCR